MTLISLRSIGSAATLWACLALPAQAHDITSAPKPGVAAPFDIVATTVTVKDGNALFRIAVSGNAGEAKPEATGKFPGAGVHAYVWPTSLNSADVGFERDQGIVALTATFHPDFDDGAAGAKNATVWHAHWVVLAKDPTCGAGLKVVDIPEGAKPTLPATWPGVPLLIDSPAYRTSLEGPTVEVEVPIASVSALPGASFDGVTAGLRIDANLHAPLLCVTDVFKVASGDLSLPGKVTPAE